MPLEEQKWWIIFVTSLNIQISSLTNLRPAINELSVSIKTDSIKTAFWYLLAC